MYLSKPNILLNKYSGVYKTYMERFFYLVTCAWEIVIRSQVPTTRQQFPTTSKHSSTNLVILSYDKVTLSHGIACSLA